MNQLIDRLPRFPVFPVIRPTVPIVFLLPERYPFLQHRLPWMDAFRSFAKVVLSSKEVGLCKGRRHRRRRSGIPYQKKAMTDSYVRCP